LLLVLAKGEDQDAGDGATATIPATITPSLMATPAVPIVVMAVAALTVEVVMAVAALTVEVVMAVVAPTVGVVMVAGVPGVDSNRD
jgi:membrane protein implicated in regulation of membrane protease activity